MIYCHGSVISYRCFTMSDAQTIWRKRVIIILIALVFLYILTSKFTWIVRDQMQQMHSGPVALNGVTVKQTFVAEQDNLFRIDLYMASFSKHHSGEMELIIGKSGSSKVLRRSIVKASAIKDNQFLPFVFRPISDSKNKRFFFKVKGQFWPQDVSVWFYSVEDSYPSGAGYVNSRSLGGDLKFSTLSKVPLGKAALVVLSRISHGKPSFFGFALFYVVLFACYILAISFFIVHMLSLGKG